MPIFDDAMPLEQMEKSARNSWCAQCGGSLHVGWGGFMDYKGYILRCGTDINHNTITRHEPKTEYQKIIENDIRRVNQMDSTALTKMDENTMLARVNMAKFPQDLTIIDKKLLANVAISYGLDPLMGEVSIYQGRPYVSIDGRYRMAQETGRLDGVETRPANKQERADWEIPDGDYFFRSEVYVKGAPRPFVGWGWVKKLETAPGSSKQGDTTSTYKPIQKAPQRMAEKRAEAQALRKAFHIPLPSVEDIGSPEDRIDRRTGEIIEGSCETAPDKPAQDVRPEPAKQATPTADQDFDKLEGAERPKSDKPKRDPLSIKTGSDLFKACREDWKLTPAQVLKELNVDSTVEIADLADAYRKIATVRV